MKNNPRLTNTLADWEHLLTDQNIQVPEIKLWWICLLHGIHNATNGNSDDTLWCFSNKFYPGSFLWITEYLDLPPHLVRKQITKNPKYFKLLAISRIGKKYNKK